ncbi:MAG: hypothetical protein KJ017_05230 [Alphaproteobacteria bacterium]|nr:hypothetical protein [Alphaproteobacteria bacterium]
MSKTIRTKDYSKSGGKKIESCESSKSVNDNSQNRKSPPEIRWRAFRYLGSSQEGKNQQLL